MIARLGKRPMSRLIVDFRIAESECTQGQTIGEPLSDLATMQVIANKKPKATKNCLSLSANDVIQFYHQALTGVKLMEFEIQGLLPKALSDRKFWIDDQKYEFFLSIEVPPFPDIIATKLLFAQK